MSLYRKVPSYQSADLQISAPLENGPISDFGKLAQPLNLPILEIISRIWPREGPAQPISRFRRLRLRNLKVGGLVSPAPTPCTADNMRDPACCWLGSAAIGAFWLCWIVFLYLQL